jgi:linoleate 10R-lipoxygenase
MSLRYLRERIIKRVDFIADSRAPLGTDGARPQSHIFEKTVTEIHELIVKPAFQLSDLGAYWDAIQNLSTVGLDDRKLLLEKVLVLMSRLQHTEVSLKVQQFVINLLYKDLPHPPSSYLALSPSSTLNEILEDPSTHAPVKYAYRAADGSNYNPLSPTLGKAGSPYARSVPSANFVPNSALPDPGLVFDTLLRRQKFVPHSGGISSLFFAFADLVIHSIFNTNHSDWSINDASSYLDLSVLYGSSESQVNSVRRKDGTGKLFDDVFADSRLLFMPPASCALLILLNRNHNYIAEKILNINENGNFSSPPPEDKKLQLAQDDEIFHRARLVNCGYFMHIILGDYVGAILGLARDESDWRLDPLMTMRDIGHEFVPQGEGNVVSIEFNLLYRWHATLSAQDETWTEGEFNKFFKGKNPNDVTIEDFKNAAHEFMIPPEDPRVWTFKDLKRDGKGRFNDADLAKILQDATEWRAREFGARGTPEVLRVIEIMGMKQARSWGTCSLNEFRKFLGLKPYKTFEEWNPDREIHTAAAALYRDIDNLELHVGLQAEQTKEPGPGAGLCPGYTISRAILADAVCLTRGDRFLTVDFTPFNLTSWGYQDCQYDKKDGSFGGLLTKLLFRTLPEHYQRGSAYAHFPFLDPVYMRENLAKTNPSLVDKYIWTRPRQDSPTLTFDTFVGVKEVLKEPHFVSAYDHRLYNVVKPFLPKTRPSAFTTVSKRMTIIKKSTPTTAVTPTKENELPEAIRHLHEGVSQVSSLIHRESTTDWVTFFSKTTEDLIKAKTFEPVSKGVKYVDIVKDVINILPILWISQSIAGLPLKTSTNPSGAWYEQEISDNFAVIASYVYLNFDPVNDWRLRESSQRYSDEILRVIHAHIEKLSSGSKLSIPDALNHLSIDASNKSHDFLKKVVDANGKKYTTHELAAQVFSAIIPTAPLYSQAIAKVVDFYLSKEQAVARQEIVNLATSKEKDAPGKILAYVREALRQRFPFP